MVDSRAEDDDEEGFGDFTFASSFSNSALHSNQINGRKPTLSNDDDDWGDFVESPLRSELSTGIFNTQPPSIASLSSKPSDPFGYFSNQSQRVPPTESAPIRAESEKTRWVKPKGALPLSIFGDLEQEKEQSDVVDPPFGDADSVAAFKKGTDTVVGVNEIIPNFFNQIERIKDENGFNSDSNGSDRSVIETNLNLNGVSSRGMHSNSNLFAVKSGIESPHVNTVGGLNLVSGSNNLQSQQIKAVNGLNSSSSEMNLNTDFFSGNIGFDEIADLFSQDQQNNLGTSNGLSSNLSTSSPIPIVTDSYSDPVGGNEEFDGDFDGWEFQDAYSEPKAGVGNDKVYWKQEGNLGVTGLSSELGNGSQGSDLFSSSNEFSVQPREVDISFDFMPLTVAQNGFSSDSFVQSERNGAENGLNSDRVVRTASNESFGDFEGALAGLNQERNETVSNNPNEALPLSLFGDEELNTADSPNVEDAFAFKPPYPRNGINNQGSITSINDLISNLYIQAEQIPPLDNREKHTGNGLDSFDELMDLSRVNGDDDFEDASWDFKDAVIRTGDIDQSSQWSNGDTRPNVTTNMTNYMDFYCKLKDQLSFVCRGHLENLKRAKYTAALSGEDAKAVAIEEEIQEACKELQKENIYSKECSEDELTREASLKEFIEVSKMKFHVLESEYGLPERLHLAEKDLGSAVELMKHAASMLDILTLGSTKDQGVYLSTWSKIISVCTQELKHGSWIWKQLVEKDIQSEILSEPRGKGFILSLGEIYRVVAVLGASVKLYKPWILSSSLDCTSIYTLLEECQTLWLTSGIEEALKRISDPIDFDYHNTVKALLESINFIHDHDEFTLENQTRNREVSVCRLSLLTSAAVPEIKMVLWHGKYYFLPLANLWANCISCDPPELPYLDVDS